MQVMREHENSENESPRVTCRNCGFITMNPRTLNKHISAYHNGNEIENTNIEHEHNGNKNGNDTMVIVEMKLVK